MRLADKLTELAEILSEIFRTCQLNLKRNGNAAKLRLRSTGYGIQHYGWLWRGKL